MIDTNLGWTNKPATTLAQYVAAAPVIALEMPKGRLVLIAGQPPRRCSQLPTLAAVPAESMATATGPYQRRGTHVGFGIAAEIVRLDQHFR